MSISATARRKLIKAFEMRERAKELFMEADRLEDEALQTGIEPGTSLMVKGIGYTLIDNFENKNTVFRMSRVKRMEFKADKKKSPSNQE
jgi:hypothetical protein